MIEYNKESRNTPHTIEVIKPDLIASYFNYLI